MIKIHEKDDRMLDILNKKQKHHEIGYETMALMLHICWNNIASIKLPVIMFLIMGNNTNDHQYQHA